MDTLPDPALTWVYTHCRAIGMTCKSDSGRWEHDIALFTSNQQEDITKLRLQLRNYLAATSVPDERKAFETAFPDLVFRRFAGDVHAYADPLTARCWAVWQASALRRGPGPQHKAPAKPEVQGPDAAWYMPSYGSIPWAQLGADVQEANHGYREGFKFKETRDYPGHQSVSMNFNSLARIVDKYRTKALPHRARDPLLSGTWHHGNGVLVCGTLRIARVDFDTSPAPEVAAEILDWVCGTLNADSV